MTEERRLKSIEELRPVRARTALDFFACESQRLNECGPQPEPGRPHFSLASPRTSRGYLHERISATATAVSTVLNPGM